MLDPKMLTCELPEIHGHTAHFSAQSQLIKPQLCSLLRPLIYTVKLCFNLTSNVAVLFVTVFCHSFMEF